MNKLDTPSMPARTRSWNNAMSVSPGELDLHIPADRIDGAIPSELHGSRVLSNGPGWTRIGDRTAHPFDGHGYMRSFAFEADGSVRLRARFVDTPVYKAEAEAGRLLHRGFATNVSSRFWQNLRYGIPRNVANTTVVRWGGKVLAGWEAGAPHAMDPDSLATLGEETFGGAVDGQATLAHMLTDAVNKRLVLCNPAMGRKTKLTFREIDEKGREVQSRMNEVDGALFIHDFALTAKHYVFGGNPLSVKFGELAKALMGASTMLRAIATNTTKPGTLHLVPRDPKAPMRTVTLPEPSFVVHFGNAHEEEDGTVIVDACVFHHFEFGEEFGYTGPAGSFDPTLPEKRGAQRLYRITVPPNATEATWVKLTEHGVDFPRFHPEHEGRKTPLLFGATQADTRYSDPFDSLLRIDLRDPDHPGDLWTAPPNVFVGEPLFAPRPDQDDAGHVMAILSNGLKEETTLAVFNAGKLSAGPIATVPMPLLPIAFHGDWDPGSSAN